MHSVHVSRVSEDSDASTASISPAATTRYVFMRVSFEIMLIVNLT